MRKRINIIILILLSLIALTIYFSFFSFTNKTKTEILTTANGIIEEITVDYEAYGNPLSKVNITNIEETNAQINNIATKMDSPFDISANFSNLQLKEATVSIKYNVDKLGEDVEEENLIILWYDEKNNKMVEMPTEVNSNNHTVTFKTDHFSQYVLVDKSVWQGIWAREVAKIRENDVKFSIEFIIDDSGSMNSNDPTKTRVSAAETAISSLSNNDEYLIMKFSDNSEVLQNFTNNTENIEKVFENFQSSGGTNISDAVEKGIDILKKEDDDRKKVIILLTDGEDNRLSSRIDELVEKAKNENIIIFGIGLQSKNDSNLNFDTFSDLAIKTEGRFYKINETELSNIYIELTNATVGVDGNQDTDGDGLPDGIELSGMRDQYGNMIITNPYLADTDGDGISDAEEMGKLTENLEGQKYYERISDPLTNEDAIVEYKLGPTNNGEEVHDSGFRANINALSFANFVYDGSGGVCAGFAYFTEKVYNGRLVLKDGKYGENLDENVFKSLITSKKLYDYKLGIDNLDLKISADKSKYSREVESSNIESENDRMLINEIINNFNEANTFGNTLYRNTSSPTTFTDNMIEQIADIFDKGEIVTIGLSRIYGVLTQSNHLINGYALEKMSDTEYRIYVYDNNFPYNPYCCSDAYNGNLYITLKKIDYNKYSFEYAPYGDENERYHWRTKDGRTGMSIYYKGEHLNN